MFLVKLAQFILALIVCSITLLLPYRLRYFWFNGVAWLVHAPFKAFGKVARYLLSKTDTENPYAH